MFIFYQMASRMIVYVIRERLRRELCSFCLIVEGIVGGWTRNAPQKVILYLLYCMQVDRKV